MTGGRVAGSPLLTDGRDRISFAIRSSSHLTLALLAWPKRRRSVVAGALAVSLVADGWRRRPGRPQAGHRAVCALLDGVDGALWTLLAPAGPEASIPIQFLVGATTGLGVGLDPADGADERDGIRALTVGVAAQLLVLGARRRTGQSAERFLVVPAIFTTAAALAAVRHRAALHEAARAEWRARAARHVAHEHQGAAVSAAVAPSPGHDFKKTLVALGELGSRSAWEAARTQGSHPAIALTRAEGTTVFRAALGIPVEPPERADTWLSADQCPLLDRFIDAIDDEMEGHGPPPRITVVDVDGLEVHLRYRGRDLRLTNPPPPVRGIELLDPTVCLLPGLAATGKGLAAFNPAIAADLRAMWPGAAFDLVGALAAAHARSAGTRHPATVAIAAMCVGSAVSNVATACVGPRPPAGIGGYQGTAYATFPAIAMLAARGHRMDRRRRWLVSGVVVGAWAVGTGYRQPEPVRRLALGAALLVQGYVAAQGVTGGLLGDREVIETELQREFAREVRAARTEARSAELGRFRAQVELAERELGRLGAGADPDLVDRMAEQCKEVREWLEQQAAAPA